MYLGKVNCFVDAWKYGERGETRDSLLMFPPEIFYTVNTVPLCLFSWKTIYLLTTNFSSLHVLQLSVYGACPHTSPPSPFKKILKSVLVLRLRSRCCLISFSECAIWTSEASPTLGCSIEISRDIYICVSVVCQINCVGGIMWIKTRACSKSVLDGKIQPVTRIIHFDYTLEQL